MAVPKLKISKTRRDKRRSHHGLKPPNLVECPECHQPKLPHKVCMHCGFYKDREIIPTKE